MPDHRLEANEGRISSPLRDLVKRLCTPVSYMRDGVANHGFDGALDVSVAIDLIFGNWQGRYEIAMKDRLGTARIGSFDFDFHVESSRSKNGRIDGIFTV